ncbi:c-type cytochrome [Legionella hackeliae]|uniref:Cytochrome c4 n=1 Tax=Legionella hackeliae TaxID=449 RepID=A0A0A8UPD4_LEGHA|nr:c-type cytochrome [Legionella hackeliae]KTD13549.1 cytochrome c4 [Legionella hackeliae]CEK09396.1 Cytochrome c4 [Legionella hackeliae]STX49303.1 cytochrome c4 [Legionella hackeliae]
MKKIVFALIVFCTFTSNAAEQTTPAPAKATVCVACHGQQGVSLNPEWPNIAGQHASYILKQLQDYKKGTTRNAPAMVGIVATLSEADMAELAAFYAKQPLPEGVTPQKYLKRGEQLYRGGDFEKHITACIACHGPRGTGNGQAGFPVLSGQHAPYTIQQLQAFKDKKRSNDLNSIMRDISARMSHEDMEAVAFYMQGLH